MIKKISKEKILYCKACGTAFPYSKELEKHIKKTKVVIKK